VDGLHARLAPLQNSFHLVDASSIAGTWINYTPIPPDGVMLEHGDLIHFGRSGFRFTLRDGSHRRKPTARPLEPPA
jgi:pSer/pThr/pTyr-binding forkhead associated (FHA) protein